MNLRLGILFKYSLPTGVLFLKGRYFMIQTKRILGLVLCLICVSLITACSSKPTTPSFEGRTLAQGKVGEVYSQNVSIENSGMIYTVHYKDKLPLGLEISEDGVISGIPQAAESQTFTIVAMTDTDTLEAEFTIAIMPGTLVFAPSTLLDASVGEPFVQNIATVTNAENVIYTLKQGSELPRGIRISERGELSGIPEATGDYSFTVVASAESNEPAEAVFTLRIAQGAEKSVSEGRIIFEGQTLANGEVGTAYAYNVGGAYGVPDITYKIQYVDGIGLPKGLEFNPLGMISGTPQDSTAGVMKFRVVASAEGYDSVTVECFLNVLDVYVQTSRFEAEHIDVSKLKGAGYSSSPTGTGMLQKFMSASNGYALGYLHKALQFEFRFTSDRESTGILTLGLGTETGTIAYTPETLGIKINGTPLDYGSIKVEENGFGQKTTFQTITLDPSIQILEGDNVVTFEIKDTLEAGGDGTMTAIGPLVDYIEVHSDGTTIGWRPKVANTR